MPDQTVPDSILFLSGLHPSDQHCPLVMHDFNQEFVVARVLKPERQPSHGTLIPVLIRVQHITEDIKSRIHRRYDSEQATDFVIGGCRFTGRIIQIEYRREEVLCEDSTDVDVMMFMIECGSTHEGAPVLDKGGD